MLIKYIKIVNKYFDGNNFIQVNLLGKEFYFYEPTHYQNPLIKIDLKNLVILLIVNFL